MKPFFLFTLVLLLGLPVSPTHALTQRLTNLKAILTAQGTVPHAAHSETGIGTQNNAASPKSEEELGALAQQFYQQQMTSAQAPDDKSGGGDPGPMAMTERFFTGAAAGDAFGLSVATAGDVNGDGHSDVIVGAPFNDTGGLSAGRVYIYFGGASMDNVADVLLTGAAANDLFGNSVATAGDVNGDGYSDVIVGAPLQCRRRLECRPGIYLLWRCEYEQCCRCPAHRRCVK